MSILANNSHSHCHTQVIYDIPLASFLSGFLFAKMPFVLLDTVPDCSLKEQRKGIRQHRMLCYEFIPLLMQDFGSSKQLLYNSICKSSKAGPTFLVFGRVATGEELLPVNHLLPGQVSEVPSHVREPLQDALQSVPLSDYSPLDHYSGAFAKLAVCVFCGL